MGKVVASTNIALDGVVEAPDRWFFPFWSEELSRSAHEELLASDALLLGRVTYEEFAEFWPTATDESEIAEQMNSLPKYVASTTLTEPLSWNPTTLFEDHVPEEVAWLKKQTGGDILLLASASLMQTLMEHDLVDEYRLRVAPAVAGGGKRLFSEGSGTRNLSLVETRTFDTGVVALTYRATGNGG
ncbi:MAG TPA: dihydrofolate reductase family protein [Rubrobacter sp.]|nr:dihydrofolate reductase family protein [Rubrobacter sp.]